MVQGKRKISFLRSKTCFCAFCRSERRRPPAAHVGVMNMTGAAVASLLLMYMAWHEFDGRVLVLFIGFLSVAECFLQIRWRLALPCRECGFDPVLYLKRPHEAAEKVKLHLARRHSNPKRLFSKRPNLNLPVRRVRKGELTPLVKTVVGSAPPGRMLSKSV